MKRILAAALAAFLLITFSGCGAQDEAVHEDDAALGYILEIADKFEYGSLKCYKYSTKDLWSLISSSCEEAVFGGNERGSVSVSYRMRNPVVFLYWPSYDYYDGENYYYKSGGEWFVDGYGRFSERLTLSYYGLDSTALCSLKLVEDKVYRTGSGYRLHLLGLDMDGLVVRVDMDVTSELEPRNLVIRTHHKNYVDYVECRFSDYNSASLKVELPSGLDISEVNYLLRGDESSSAAVGE